MTLPLSGPGQVVRAIKSAGVPITGMTFGDHDDPSTWKVEPANLQRAAQPVIDAFVFDPDADVERQVDDEIGGNDTLLAMIDEVAAARGQTHDQVKARVRAEAIRRRKLRPTP